MRHIIVAISLLSASITNAAVEEEMIVTGMRQSLTQSMDIKRESSGVVDAISSEDIGKMPDSNLAESLQLITGVSIDRTRGEGDAVTVRGFGPAFNLVTLNGRQMPTVSSPLSGSGISRNFSFRNISAESVSGVEVFKSGFAGAPSGGIGATINLKTARPLDSDTVGVVSVKAISENDEYTPEWGAMFSGVQSLGAYGTMGIMLGASDSERKYHEKSTGSHWYWGTGYPGPQEDSAASKIDTSSSWNPDGLTWRTAEFGISQSDYQRERENLQGTLQYEPFSGLTFTYDHVQSSIDDRGDMVRASYWLDFYDEGKADSNGTMSTISSDDETVVFWAWEYNYLTENNSDAFNIAWEATDNLTLTLDHHDSSAHANPGLLPAERLSGGDIKGPGDISGSGTLPVRVTGHFDGSPYAEFETNLEKGAFSWDYLEPGHYQERGFELENRLSQTQLTGELAMDFAGLHTVNFGLGRIENRLNITELLETNFGLGTPQGEAYPNPVMDLSQLEHKAIPGWAGFDVIHAWDPDQFISLVDQQELNQDSQVNIDRDRIEEITNSLYLSTAGQWGRIKATAGIRYEETSVQVESVTAHVDQLHFSTNAQLDRIYGPQITAYNNGSYSELLPSLDVSFDATDDVVIRGSVSNTIARSSLGALYPADVRIKDVRLGQSMAQQGNPNLKPYKADNADLSAEWYYGEGSYLSAGAFYKSVDNFISSVATDEPLLTTKGTPLTNPSARPGIEAEGCPSITKLYEADSPCLSRATDAPMNGTVTRPMNQKTTSVHGLEVNIQHLFGESGFGAIANYTLVKSADAFDPYRLDNTFALSGLSDTANLVAFYEKNGFQARIAWNWRDKFYAGPSAGSADPVEPRFVAEYQQFDAQVSYQFNDYVRIFVEGINLTNELYHSHGRFENQIYKSSEYAPRYAIGASASF